MDLDRVVNEEEFEVFKRVMPKSPFVKETTDDELVEQLEKDLLASPQYLWGKTK